MARQLAREKVVHILRAEGALVQAQSRQGIAAASDGQSVIAGGDGIALAPLLNEHAVVGKGGLGGPEHTFDAGEGKVVAGLLGVVAQGEVRHGELHLLSQLQQEARGDAVLGADVRVDEGVGLHAVDVSQEEAQHLLGEGAVLSDHEGLQQLVQVAEVDREGGDGRDVAVEDFEGVDRLEQILRRIEGEELAAVFEQQLVIGADIARAVGHDALVEVAERALLPGFVVFVGIAQGVVGALAEAGQGEQLLFIGQGRVLDNMQGFGHGYRPPIQISGVINADKHLQYTPRGTRGQDPPGDSARTFL